MKREEQEERARKWGLVNDEINRLIDHIASEHGVTNGDTTLGYNHMFYTLWMDKEGPRPETLDDLVAYMYADARAAAQKIKNMPDVMPFHQGSSQHSETWRAGGQEASVRSETTIEVIRQWFRDQGISEEPRRGMYDRDEPFTFAGHGDWQD